MGDPGSVRTSLLLEVAPTPVAWQAQTRIVADYLVRRPSLSRGYFNIEEIQQTIMDSCYTFCSLTGGCYYTDSDEVILDFVNDACDGLLQNDRLRPSDSILERLKYSADDVAGSQDFVSLAPRLTQGGLTPTVFSNSTVAAVFKAVTIGANRNTDRFKRYNIFFYVYRILIGRFPELQPHMIYATLANSEWSDTCNGYSHIMKRQFPCCWKVADVSEDDLEDPEENGYGNLGKWEYFWLELLCAEDKSEDEIVRDAWFGVGNLYHFARADNFPKSKPLASFPGGQSDSDTLFTKLPFDVLEYLCFAYLSIGEVSSLLCLDCSLRATLLPFVDGFAKKAIAHRHPYWLPIVAPCVRGNEEQLRWERMWEGLGGEVPWAPYARECGKSPGMRNRQRIWGMTEMFRNKVKEQGWLDGRISV